MLLTMANFTNSMRMRVTKHLMRDSKISPFRLAKLLEENKLYDVQRSLKPFTYSYIKSDHSKNNLLIFKTFGNIKMGSELLNNEFDMLDYLLYKEDLPIPKPLTKIEKNTNMGLNTFFILKSKQGISLASLIENSNPTIDLLKKIKYILIETAFILSEIHKLNVIHGNLIPSNIFLTNQGVYLENFEFSIFKHEFLEKYNLEPSNELDTLLDSIERRLLESKFNEKIKNFIYEVKYYIKSIYSSTSLYLNKINNEED